MRAAGAADAGGGSHGCGAVLLEVAYAYDDGACPRATRYGHGALGGELPEAGVSSALEAADQRRARGGRCDGVAVGSMKI